MIRSLLAFAVLAALAVSTQVRPVDGLVQFLMKPGRGSGMEKCRPLRCLIGRRIEWSRRRRGSMDAAWMPSSSKITLVVGVCRVFREFFRQHNSPDSSLLLLHCRRSSSRPLGSRPSSRPPHPWMPAASTPSRRSASATGKTCASSRRGGAGEPAERR